MKIKQLFTSFLACMALWSAPVYADTESDVYEKYKKFKDDKAKYGTENAYRTPTIDNPSVEQLKDDMDKKKGILDNAKEYQKSIKAFNEKYTKYLGELKNAIDKADNEKNRFRKKRARGDARDKMEALVKKAYGTNADAFQEVVGITAAFLSDEVKGGIKANKIEADVKTMKDRFNKEITNAKNTLIKEENNLTGIIADQQADYDKALEAYNYKKTQADLKAAKEANKKAKEERKKAKAEKKEANKKAKDKKAERKAEQEAKKAERKAKREAEKAERKAKREAEKEAAKEEATPTAKEAAKEEATPTAKEEAKEEATPTAKEEETPTPKEQTTTARGGRRRGR